MPDIKMPPQPTKSSMKKTQATNGSESSSKKVEAGSMRSSASTTKEKESSSSKSNASTNTSTSRFKSKTKVRAQTRQSTRPSAKLKQLLPEEMYQVHIEFPADAPTRVVVRLERLMGTDKVRLTDTKYMMALLEKIFQEEENTLLKRTVTRKRDEWERHKNLAVEGLVEPGEGMDDIRDHPVFRMNRILNRLTRMGDELSREPSRKFPPITPIEPFKNGGAPEYVPNPEGDIEVPACEDVEGLDDGEEETIDMTHWKLQGRRNFDGEEDEGDEELSTMPETDAEDQEVEMGDIIEGEWGGEDYRPDRTESILAEARLRYGIPNDVNLEYKCKPYRSKLVDMVFEEDQAEGEVNEMFDLATEVLGAYKREALVSDDFVITLTRMSLNRA